MLAENEPKVDFSRKCRDKISFNFQRLRKHLEQLDEYRSLHEWNRFSILERAAETVKRLAVNNNIQSVESKNNCIWDRNGLDNKDLCKLYRSRLNNTFDQLLNELKRSNMIELSQYRTTSRAGILEAACDFLASRIRNQHHVNLEGRSTGYSGTKKNVDNRSLPRPAVTMKRTRSESESSESASFSSLPNKRLASSMDDSGYSSPYAMTSTAVQYSATQFTPHNSLADVIAVQNRMAIYRIAFAQLLQRSRSISAATSTDKKIWQPWL